MRGGLRAGAGANGFAEESWRDLVRLAPRERASKLTPVQSSHGFDRNLQLVPVRREDVEVDEGEPVPCVGPPFVRDVLTRTFFQDEPAARHRNGRQSRRLARKRRMMLVMPRNDPHGRPSDGLSRDTTNSRHAAATACLHPYRHVSIASLFGSGSAGMILQLLRMRELPDLEIIPVSAGERVVGDTALLERLHELFLRDTCNDELPYLARLGQGRVDKHWIATLYTEVGCCTAWQRQRVHCAEQRCDKGGAVQGVRCEQ